MESVRKHNVFDSGNVSQNDYSSDDIRFTRFDTHVRSVIQQHKITIPVVKVNDSSFLIGLEIYSKGLSSTVTDFYTIGNYMIAGMEEEQLSDKFKWPWKNYKVSELVLLKQQQEKEDFEEIML